MSHKQFTAEQRVEYKAARRQESRELIESAARELLTSEGWQRYAEVRAAFHRYSFGNCLLIAMQRLDATQVTGFRKWQELGRQVRNGERGLRILAPHTAKRTDENGDEETITYFVSVSVFDVARTDGEPLPGPPAGEPITGDSHAPMLPRLEAFARSIGWGVEYGDCRNADGYAAPAEQRIRISDKLAEPNRRVRTLIHEIVHALGIGYGEYDREVAEVLTETAAYVVCRLDRTRHLRDERPLCRGLGRDRPRRDQDLREQGRGARPPNRKRRGGVNRMTTDQLRKAEAAYQAAFRRAEQAREARNAAIRQAIAEGWTHARISEATGLTRSRIGQIAQS